MLNEAAQPARRRHVQAMRSALEQARGSLPAVPSRAPFGAAIRLPLAPARACRVHQGSLLRLQVRQGAAVALCVPLAASAQQAAGAH